jgi:hypothetical protein
MDGSRFDLLARTFADSISRRITLGGLAGGVLAAIDLVPVGNGLAEKKGKKRKRKQNKKKKCSNGRERCGGTCCQAEETCQQGTCIDRCQDGVQNFGETDIDCGRVCLGRNVPFGTGGPCGLFQRCEVPEDCFKGLCEVVANRGRDCVECRIDSDCDRNSFTFGKRCVGNLCSSCAADFDCRPPTPFCVAPPNSSCQGQPCLCRQCRVDTDCPQGQLCDEQGSCEGFVCDSNQDCPTGRACENGACTGTCVPAGGDITDEGDCCSEVDCAVDDRDICCDFGETCLAGGGNGRCG